MKVTLKHITKNSNTGFSLVELIVVVAVIGILAAVGIPQYSKFKGNAYMAEAKSSLANLYTAEKAFYIEFNGYHSSFQAIGFTPPARGVYNVGFGDVGTAPVGYTTNVDTVGINSKTVCTGFGSGPANSSCSLIYNTPDVPSDVTVATGSFKAAAMSIPSQYTKNENELTGNPFVNVALTAMSSTAQAVMINPPGGGGGGGGGNGNGDGYMANSADLGMDAWSIDDSKIIRHNLTWYVQCPAIQDGYISCGNGGGVVEVRDSNGCVTGWVCQAY